MTSRRSARLLAKAAPASPPRAGPAAAAANGRVAKKAKARGDKPAASAPASIAIPAALLSASPPATLADHNAMATAIRHLKEVDPRLGRLIDNTTETCSMSLPRDKSTDTSFVSLCQSVIFQQLAGKAAQAILLRFLRRFGTLKDAAAGPPRDRDDPSLGRDDFIFPTPTVVATLDVDEMKAVGLGQRKAEYISAVAERFNDGTLSEELLASMPDDEVSRALVAIRGIGQWTADMFLMFHLKRPNVLPTLDLAVRKAMCHHFGVPFGKKTPTHEQLVELGRVWEPYRSVATWYMWRLSNTITQKS
ncbi:hypothetical protein LPJ61_002603 [Coemansia biformis]|uniref:HhH-GPD domain-containing protein n=1 Tax=Coemansia biformis TaxID=1286918 RepID=A0A9W8CZG9_9FUNG|nr:hypothetical protein LPJ61_002603 [Coemansia biformis]